ncbi:hypothetical protein Moror_5633 [Moniliophthora roreri MCA 2997]|uniref:Uncharacterized protein n=1 Tax=Moniliophthora roreri (strain MCA 2997) TaxID=1381753 RepID=V2XTN6_MONRO|nr:hypothetical protein Moror_5633 [Moniliophthora roreri MCA 2997]
MPTRRRAQNNLPPSSNSAENSTNEVPLVPPVETLASNTAKLNGKLNGKKDKGRKKDILEAVVKSNGQEIGGALPDLPAQKRTSAQVKADQVAQKAIIEEQEWEYQKKLLEIQEIEEKMQKNSEAQRQMALGIAPSTNRPKLHVLRKEDKDAEYIDTKEVDEGPEESDEADDKHVPTPANQQKPAHTLQKKRTKKAAANDNLDPDANEDDATRGLMPSSETGGFQDSDTMDVMPKESKKKKAVKVNQFISLNSDPEDAGQKPLKRPSTAQPTKAKNASPAPSWTGSTDSLPSLPSIPSAPPSQDNMDDEAKKTKLRGKPMEKQLPIFAHGTVWKTVFIATIRHLAFTQPNPMAVKKDRDLVNMVQSVMNKVFPNDPWPVRLDGDAVLQVSYDHIKDTQNNIGTEAFKLVSNFFQQPDYAEDHRLEKGKAGYKPPEGIFESDLIIEMMQKHIIPVYKCSIETGKPKGALAMVISALDRAFLICQHNNGIMPEKPNDQFSDAKYGKHVSQYMKSIEHLSTWYWNHLLEMYGQNIDKAVPETFELEDDGCDNLFIPSSPKKD